MTTRTSTKWTEEALDRLGQVTDERADACVRDLLARKEVASLTVLFDMIDLKDPRPLDEILGTGLGNCPTLSAFLADTKQLPEWTDVEKMQEGQALYMAHIYPVALILLCKSLPEGYAAPNLSRVLSVTDLLGSHPYRRLLATLQMVLDVVSGQGFDAQRRTIATTQKVRLLHAALRSKSGDLLPGYEAQYGVVPINQCDMLATLMAFSYLVIEALPQLGIAHLEEEREKLLYPWLVFAALMGIHPPGEPSSMKYVPESFAECRAFFEAYKRKFFVGPDQNPQGVHLARADLKMMEQIIPFPLRVLGFGRIPGIYMWQLMGPESCERLGIQRPLGHKVIPILLRLVQGVFRNRGHHKMSGLVFRWMIHASYRGKVVFQVPPRILREVVRKEKQIHPTFHETA